MARGVGRRAGPPAGAALAGLAALCAPGCVVAVDEHVTLDVPVAGIVVRMEAGDVEVRGARGPVVLSGARSGPSGQPAVHEVVDGVLTLDLDCRFCGGSVAIEAPPATWLEVDLGEGSVAVSGMAAAVSLGVDLGSASVDDHGAGEISARVGAGDLTVSRRRADPITARVGTGDLDVRVPAGPWDLAVEADRGRVRIDPALTDDPSGPRLRATVERGAIEVRAR